jgi:hypothetical protein
MRAIILFSLSLGIASTGCSFDGDLGSNWGSEDDAGSYSNDTAGPAYILPPDECMPSASAFAAMQTLHDDNESKVHELIKCGGMQTSMSRNFLVVIVASNRDLFDEQAYAELVDFAHDYGVDLEVPFNHEADGSWTVPINAVTNSVFTVRIYDSGGLSMIQQDPFLMESYLTGVTATSSLTIDEMKADLFARNTITFSWADLAPLAHELNGGQPIPNPFTISVSFADLAEYLWGTDLAKGDPDLGPLDSVLDMKVDSEVVLSDSIGSTHVEYDVAGLRGTLREVSANGVAFDVKHILATNGEYSQEGSATDLRYAAGPGTLVGRFDYRIHGPEGDLAVSDTYDPTTGMRVEWSCPK